MLPGAQLHGALPAHLVLPHAFLRLPEQDGAFESVAFSQNTGNRRAGFFATVLVVGSDKQNMLALPRPRGTLVDDTVGGDCVSPPHEKSDGSNEGKA